MGISLCALELVDRSFIWYTVYLLSTFWAPPKCTLGIEVYIQINYNGIYVNVLVHLYMSGYVGACVLTFMHMYKRISNYYVFICMLFMYTCIMYAYLVHHIIIYIILCVCTYCYALAV